MRFWDTSAVIPLLVDEENSDLVGKLLQDDPSLVVWWGTSIECVSAVSRLEREEKLSAKDAIRVIDRLDTLRNSWREIQPAQRLKATAERILRVHPLRAQDAQQLAACLIASQDNRLVFVSLDSRLVLAARKEGVTVLSVED